MAERRIASHPDDPTAPLDHRLLLALGMWPSYIDELGADSVIEAAVILRSTAHRFQFAAEDWSTARDEADGLRDAVRAARELLRSDDVAGAADLLDRSLNDGTLDDDEEEEHRS